MKIAICDDNSQERASIKKMIKSIASCVNSQISEFSSGTTLLSSHKLRHFDIIMMDVDMPNGSGIDTGKCLRKNDKNTILIFVTSYPQYAIEAYDCEAFHYLLKPVNYVQFERIMNKAVNKYSTLHSTISLDTRTGKYVLPISDICYIECLHHKLIYYTTNGCYTVRDTLSNAISILLPYGFCQTHQGFVVNMSKIQKITSNEAILSNGMTVMISVRRRKEVEQIFSNYLEKTL